MKYFDFYRISENIKKVFTIKVNYNIEFLH
jgi:hypothetical protein